MKALVFLGPNQMAWQEWPEPQVQPGEALVAVGAVGICGSDVHGYTGESGRRVPPMVMGHEASGRVIEVGSNADKDLIGQNVVVQPFVYCGQCDYCRAGTINLCRERQFLGTSQSGAMAERIVMPAKNLLPVPDALDPKVAALTEPLSVAMHAAHQAGDLKNKTVLIAGCGPIGLLTLVSVKQLGAGQVLVSDLVPERLRIAKLLGADGVVDPREQDLPQDEIDVAFDAVGIQATFDQAFQSLKPKGQLIALGGWKKVQLRLSRLVAGEIRLVGTFNFTPTEFQTALNWLADGVFDPTPVISHEFPLEDGASVFERLAKHELEGIKIILTGDVEG